MPCASHMWKPAAGETSQHTICVCHKERRKKKNFTTLDILKASRLDGQRFPAQRGEEVPTRVQTPLVPGGSAQKGRPFAMSQREVIHLPSLVTIPPPLPPPSQVVDSPLLRTNLFCLSNRLERCTKPSVQSQRLQASGVHENIDLCLKPHKGSGTIIGPRLLHWALGRNNKHCCVGTWALQKSRSSPGTVIS